MAQVCSACGATIEDPFDSFCTECGAPLQAPAPSGAPVAQQNDRVGVCPSCGNGILRNWIYCMHCGAPVSSFGALTNEMGSPGSAEMGRADAPAQDGALSMGGDFAQGQQAPQMQQPAAEANPMQYGAGFSGAPGVTQGDAKTTAFAMDDSKTVSLEANGPFAGVEQPPHVLALRRSTGEILQFIPPVKFGKGSMASVRITGNNAISRVHAYMTTDGGRYFLEDFRSTNGTFVDGVRLEPNVTTEVELGSIIRFANEDFTFIELPR